MGDIGGLFSNFFFFSFCLLLPFLGNEQKVDGWMDGWMDGFWMYVVWMDILVELIKKELIKNLREILPMLN